MVHEVYSEKGFLEKTKDWQIYHKAHHTSAVDVGKIASLSQPKKLILSHILFWGNTESSILQEVRLNYDGEDVIAEYLMIIE